jgi:hypothetical protein
MIYFALNNDGLLYDLGDHGDWECAEDTANNMKLDPLWVFDETVAKSWVEFINDRISENQDKLTRLE